MNILMMTNTFFPHVGGVARSIERFARRYSYLGHHVKVVAPEFDGMPEQEQDVVRIPALRSFNHTDFSVVLPIPRSLHKFVDTFEPDIIHSHHPFLVGGTALRVAHTHGLPLLFTHHTRYEDYTHNVPADSALLKRFVKNLATHYANKCDRVFVPSESIEAILLKRGVTAPISVVPTGVEIDRFSAGKGQLFRRKQAIPEDAFVVGHLGRLTQEKNIPFLVASIIRFMQFHSGTRPVHCLIAGSGPLENAIKSLFANAGLAERLHLAGVLEEEDLSDAYHAMDVFAFASTTETQGMVLTEAMASGIPVVALDAPGVREVLIDGINGHLLPVADEHTFADALHHVSGLGISSYGAMTREALITAERFSMVHTANKALELYSRLRNYDAAHRHPEYSVWTDTMHVLESEWNMVKSTFRSAAEAVDSSQH